MNRKVFAKQGYSFHLVNIECLPASDHFNVVMEMKDSVEELFPYLAAILHGCTYVHGAEVINFMDNGHIVAIYPRRITITDVRTLEEAVELCGTYYATIIRAKSQKDQIAPVYECRPTIGVLNIYRLLPKTNCGICCLPTCMAFAARLFRHKGRLSACTPLLSNKTKCEELKRQLQANGYTIS
jgi:ArsR family metal-binding transcriptional regulator